jgi:hypothetical protein
MSWSLRARPSLAAHRAPLPSVHGSGQEVRRDGSDGHFYSNEFVLEPVFPQLCHEVRRSG